MMTASYVGKRYARSLLELAAAEGRAEEWGAELARLTAVVMDPSVMGRLTAPDMDASVRVAAMGLVADRLGLSVALRSFARVVARHNRVTALSAISDSYQQLLDERLGRVRAILTFARPPDEDQVRRVVTALESLTGRKVVAEIRSDPNLLAGIVVELAGKTYDLSLAAQLAEAERRLCA